jgi:hypothetical protein
MNPDAMNSAGALVIMRLRTAEGPHADSPVLYMSLADPCMY